MRIIKIISLCILLQLPFVGGRLQAQSHELQVLLLDIEKLNQLREILDQMYDGYRFVTEGYNKIKKVTSGNFSLHDLFLDALLQVSPTVRKYEKVVGIVNYQLQMVREYKDAYRRFQGSNVFTEDNLEYVAEVHKRLIDESLKNLDELLLVITARQLRMNDYERITAIDRIYKDVEEQLLFLRRFNTQQNMVAIERLRERSETKSIKNFHGIR